VRALRGGDDESLRNGRQSQGRADPYRVGRFDLMLNTAVENDEGTIKEGIVVSQTWHGFLKMVAPWETSTVFLDRDGNRFVVLWTEFGGWSWEIWYQS
jgi:hypothetical protein